MSGTVLRKGCGTYLGLRMHQTSGERPCSECLRGEDIRRVEHEGIPRRPPPVYPPVTPEEAKRNLADLTKAIKQRRAS